MTDDTKERVDTDRLETYGRHFEKQGWYEAADECRGFKDELDRLRQENASLTEQVQIGAELEMKTLRRVLDAEEKCASLAAYSERLRSITKPLLQSSKLLLQNAIGCAANHYGEDFNLHGEPGWLADCRNHIADAQAALSTPAPDGKAIMD